jgi:hypothetical protein
MDRMTEQQGPSVDPIIVQYVDSVANRFGAGGLEQLIDLAGVRLEEAKAALLALADLAADQPE